MRISKLKHWLATNNRKTSLDAVGCAEHLAVAEEIAECSVTLVRDDAHNLPLTLNPEQRISVIMPRPADLTPADTSSYIIPGLADAIRGYHPNVDEFVLPYAPGEQEIQETLKRIDGSDMIVCATLNAFDCPQQAALVNTILRYGIPTIILAMRMPYDLIAFPQASTYLCSYSIQSPSMKAVARVIMGKLHPQGRIPVSIPDLYPVGHRLG